MSIRCSLFIINNYDFNPKIFLNLMNREVTLRNRKLIFQTQFSTFSQVKTQTSNFTSACAFLLFYQDSEVNMIKNLIKEIRQKNTEVPIFVIADAQTNKNQIFHEQEEIEKVFYVFNHSLDTLSRNIQSEVDSYLKRISPPFFKSLLEYNSSSSDSWHCPGHSGGSAYLKSSVGNLFHDFFGENMLKVDVCNAVEQLGQLLEHTGPISESEKLAAQIYHADHLYFVTNGTSTSNKIVWHSMVTRDDIVIIDRNCHKSVLHAIIMTGATPVYLKPSRNCYGLIGPINENEFSMESIQNKINSNPLIENKKKKPRVLTLTQSTYDGILYNAEKIKSMLDGEIDYLHFDEAWIPHATFHSFYKDMHAIGKESIPLKESLTFSTQSTHKLLAGLSQASQILVKNADNKQLNHHIFNEAYMMHTSTSPQYSIIASLDVAAAMMKEPFGEIMVEDCINEAMIFRREMFETYQSSNDWWFKIWGPKVKPDLKTRDKTPWLLDPKLDWHGFENISEKFNMLDPIKVTILTPGLNLRGEFESFGIPATIVSKYLAENGVVVEKCGLYSFFIMFTLGVTENKRKNLIHKLQQFKLDFENNAKISLVMPQFAKSFPEYQNMGLKDLANSIHLEFKKYNISHLTTQMYISEITPVMTPSDAYAKLVHGEIERVEIHQLEGKATAVLLTPYPPGIPLLIPGEKFNSHIINYLKFAESFNNLFPGFETDIHGLVCENIGGSKKYYVDCLSIT